MKHILTIPLVRQLLGAAGGAAIALCLYGTYQAAAPLVTAYLLPPGEPVHSQMTGEVAVSDKGIEQTERMDRVTARARMIAAQLRENRNASDAVSVSSFAASSVASVTSVASSSSSSAIASSRSSSVAEQAAEEVIHSGAPSLPSSGAGALFAFVATFSAGGAFFSERLKRYAVGA